MTQKTRVGLQDCDFHKIIHTFDKFCNTFEAE